MSAPAVLGATLALGLTTATGVWLLSLRLRDAAIVDVFWGFGFGAIALVAFTLAPGSLAPAGGRPELDLEGGVRPALVLSCVLLWSARLGVHMLARRRGRPEDFRYAAMRAHHGDAFGRVSLVTVFLFQAVIQWALSVPAQLALVWPGPTALGALDLLGAALFLGGLTLETVADWQLERFRADPRSHGQVMDRGLWRHSRHPNYLGEAVLWWGVGCLAVGSGVGWAALLSPAALTFLLLRVSGVPILEDGLRRRLPGYAAYAERTPAFLPFKLSG